MAGTRINDLAALSEPTVRSDRQFVGRSSDAYRQDVSAIRGGILRRKGLLSAELVKPTSGNFNTWVNQGSATLTDVGYALQLAAPHAGTSFRINAAVRTLPSGNWDVRVGARKRSMYKNYHFAGIILRESATGKCVDFKFQDDGLSSGAWSTSTNYLGDNTANAEFHNTVWFRARKFSSTQFAFFFSLDGSLWVHWDTISLTTFFTTAPDQWGIFIQPVNESVPNNDVRADFFHWQEGANVDLTANVPAYANDAGSRDRTAVITVTTDASLVDGTINNLVDGGFNNDSTDAIQVTNGQSGRHVTFQFSEAKVITAAKWFQNAAQSNGTWKWQGSNNGSSFTDISSTFTLDDATGGVGGTVIGDLSANVTAYSYYRMLQTAGTTSNAQRWREIEFKIMKG